MNILVPNTWLRDFLETNATPAQFAEAMSLTSVSIERIDEIEGDHVFDIEVTTNRPDLMSIVGIAREASAVLPQAGFKAVFKERKQKSNFKTVGRSQKVNISIDRELVNRVTAVVLEINLKLSPQAIAKRLERTGIRSINNAVDVTNYVMREVGHPMHVFDYDLLENHTLNIRKSRKGEKIVTLDEKEYELQGGDIVADNGKGEIIDLLGVMGTLNSAVNNNTKRVLLFIDNNDKNLIRKTSMNLGIRSEAAILNEKGIDPNLTIPAIQRGIELLEEIGNAKLLSEIIDLYPNKKELKTITITHEKINNLIGIKIDLDTISSILKHLGFGVSETKGLFTVKIPSIRSDDIDIEEDIVEEVARVYGYHKIPNVLPIFSEQAYYHQDKNDFFLINKLKEAFAFWGFNETYTYSMVGESDFEGPAEAAVALKNPLTEDHMYLRRTLIPSLINVARTNKNRDILNLFEISNVYLKKKTGLPEETLHLAVLIKNEKKTFFHAKGIVESIFEILGIKKYKFSKKSDGFEGADIKIDGKQIGEIEIDEFIALEINLEDVLVHANLAKKYTPPAKYPHAIEDVRVEIAPHYTFHEIEKELKLADERVIEISLLDVFENKKTFRIKMQDRTQNLTQEEITKIREKVYKVFETDFKAKIG